MQKALVYYLDAARRVLATREVEFRSRFDLLYRVERELDRCWTIEAWQEGDCLMCVKAHGAIEVRCGKPTPPTDLEPGG